MEVRADGPFSPNSRDDVFRFTFSGSQTGDGLVMGEQMAMDQVGGRIGKKYADNSQPGVIGTSDAALAGETSTRAVCMPSRDSLSK